MPEEPILDGPLVVRDAYRLVDEALPGMDALAGKDIDVRDDPHLAIERGRFKSLHLNAALFNSREFYRPRHCLPPLLERNL